VDGQACTLDIRDTAGTEDFPSDEAIHNGKGFALVYSVSCRRSFSRIKYLHGRIRSKNDGASVVLVANKADEATEREVSTEEGRALARDLGCKFVEISAKNRVLVEKAFYDMVRTLRKRQRQRTASGGEGSPRTRGGTKWYRWKTDREWAFLSCLCDMSLLAHES
jgi:GTPase KRas protein